MKKTITVSQKVIIEADDEKSFKEAIEDIKKNGLKRGILATGYRYEIKLNTIKILKPKKKGK